MIEGKLRAAELALLVVGGQRGISRRAPTDKKLLPSNYRSFNSTLTTRRTTSRLNGFSSIGSVVPRRKSA